jgi:hypothetical protein
LSENKYEDYAIIMSPAELTRYVIKHNQLLVTGNGQKSVMVRLDSVEEYREQRLEPDLYDAETGIVPQIRNFFNLQAERDKQSTNKLNRALVIVTGVAIGTPIFWDWFRHAVLGWAK